MRNTVPPMTPPRTLPPVTDAEIEAILAEGEAIAARIDAILARIDARQEAQREQ